MNTFTHLCAICELALTKSKCPSHRDLSLALEVDIYDILRSSLSPNDAFLSLYQLFKKHSSKMSLSFLCRQLNLSSKGSLGLAMKSKRGVSLDTARAVPQIFFLNESQKDLWFDLFTREKRRWSVDQLRIVRELETAE